MLWEILLSNLEIYDRKCKFIIERNGFIIEIQILLSNRLNTTGIDRFQPKHPTKKGVTQFKSPLLRPY